MRTGKNEIFSQPSKKKAKLSISKEMSFEHKQCQEEYGNEQDNSISS